MTQPLSKVNPAASVISGTGLRVLEQTPTLAAVLVVRPRHRERPVVVVRRVGAEWEPVAIGPKDWPALRKLTTQGVLVLRRVA